ncbi:transposase [Bacillus tuaregi]|uniref:transposase n=1 Tax=Bacillus tuaregi TaxID=1816695 RepID=UPI0008F8950E|nr:transposase [Bacillus tuaregi]
MSRKPRIYYPSAIYHITDRGNRCAALFYDDWDRRKYLKVVKEAQTLYPFHLHSYCLMTNHIHLQLETINHHPQKIMSMINTHYAIYFNKRYELIGHVFQGRYKANLIDSLQYFLEASKYIHLNPLEAEMVLSPESYPWSSYKAYLSPQHPDPLVTTNKILSYFPEPQIENYRSFVEEKTLIKGEGLRV